MISLQIYCSAYFIDDLALELEDLENPQQVRLCGTYKSGTLCTKLTLGNCRVSVYVHT